MPGSDFAGQLRKLGVKVLVLNDYLENAPLGRASYIRVFGALTGRMAMADSIINGIAQSYNELKDKVIDAVPADAVPGVLMNIPYADAWYVPGGTNYMSQLVSDAGAKVLGAVPGKSESSIISVEQAIILSRDASFWLNTGWCDTSRTRPSKALTYLIYTTIQRGPMIAEAMISGRAVPPVPTSYCMTW